jgi:hypothetical protein
MAWPKVLDEFETIDRVLAGASLSRHGDGELKIMFGKGYSREPENPTLTAELLYAFQTPNAGCLVAIPTMDPKGPKYENWTRHAERFERLLDPGRVYGSAFVSRPDSAPWINSRLYAHKVEAIWRGKRAVVVGEKGGSMAKIVKRSAGRAFHLSCPRHRAYDRIDLLERFIRELEPEVVILSAGPTASCLANRLAPTIQAVDLGSAGGFLSRLLA